MILFVAFWYDSWSGGGHSSLRPMADHLPRNVHFHAPARPRPNVWNDGFSLLGEPRNKPGVPYFPLNPGCLIGIPKNGLL